MSEKFRYFNGVSDTIGGEVDIERVVIGITHGGKGLKEKSEKARMLYEQPDKEPYKEFKKSFPAVIFSGRTDGKGRDISHIVEHTGLVVIDFDDVDVGGIISDLVNDPAVYLLFVSPSGEGVKVVVKVNPLPEIIQHKIAYEKVVEYFDSYDADKSGSDINRLCFLAHYPQVYFNEDSDFIEIDFDSIEKEVADKAKAKLDANNSNNNSGNKKCDLNALDFISPDIDYQVWLNVGMALKNEGFDLAVWQDWSSKGKKYKDGECEEKWNGFEVGKAGKDGNPITWGTVVYHAKQEGYKPPPMFIALEREVKYVNSNNKPITYFEDVPRHIVSEQCVEALNESEYKPYRRGHEVGYVQDGRFEPANQRGMQGIISKTCDLRKYKRPHWVSVGNPPQWIADDILETQKFEFDEIKSIINHPFFDGEKIVYEKGLYNGVYLQNEFEQIDVDDATADEDVASLKELLQDYTLAENADIENSIALMLTPFIRQVVDVSPLFFITAARANLGKSTIGEICCFLALGERPETYSLPHSKERISSAIDAALRYAPEIVFFDNVDDSKPIDSGDLATIATQPKKVFRKFQTSEQTRYENRATFIYTGSGMTASKELITRAVEIRLEDDGIRSEHRNWKIPHIIQKYLPENHSKYRNACLRMIQRWIDSNMALSAHRHRATLWAERIGGILETNGIGKHFLTNDIRMRKQAGIQDMDESNAWRVAGATLGEKRYSFTTVDIFEIFSYTDGVNGRKGTGHNLLGHIWADKPNTDEAGRRTRIGIYLNKSNGKTFECGFRIERHDQKDRTGKSLYRLVWTKSTDELIALEKKHSLNNIEAEEQQGEEQQGEVVEVGFGS